MTVIEQALTSRPPVLVFGRADANCVDTRQFLFFKQVSSPACAILPLCLYSKNRDVNHVVGVVALPFQSL